MPPGRVIEIRASLEIESFSPERPLQQICANFARKCWVGQGVPGEVLRTHARSKATLLFPGPHEAAGEAGPDLCLLTKSPLNFT